MCFVPFLFCHFPKTERSYDADNPSHDTVLKIAETQYQVVNTRSGEDSHKNVIPLKKHGFCTLFT